MTDSPELSTYFAIAPRSPEDRVLRLLVDLGCQVIEADEGALLVLDEKAKELVFAMTVGRRLAAESSRFRRIPVGKGLTGLAALTREVQVGAPRYEDPGVSRAESTGPRISSIAAPMLVGDRVVGVVTALRLEGDRHFGGREAEILGRFASVAGLIVDQRRRLADIESATSGESMSTRILSDEERLEQRIVTCVGRLVRTRADALEPMATLLESLERMTSPR